MAQQSPFQQAGTGREAEDYGLDVARSSSVRTPQFRGGSQDGDSGNLVEGTRQEAARGRTPTASDPKPIPQPTTRLNQVQLPAYRPPEPSGFEKVLGVVSTVLPILGFLCYEVGTEILMADGTYRKIEDIDLFDEVAAGGTVLGTGRAIVTDGLYEYRGCRVTGSHAVFEDGRFIRVEDARFAKRIALEGKRVIVSPIVTLNRVMVTRTHVTADFSETENGANETPDQRLEAMNADADRLNWLRIASASLVAADAA